jgi:hypothetical protein
MNTLNPATQLFIFVLTATAMLRVWFVVVAAGSETAYLAGFRN